MTPKIANYQTSCRFDHAPKDPACRARYIEVIQHIISLNASMIDPYWASSEMPEDLVEKYAPFLAKLRLGIIDESLLA